MARRLISLTVLAGLSSGILLAQKAQPLPSRKDSVTVSAGIPKEQLKIEAECDAKIEAARDARAAKKHSEAISALEQALEMIRRHSFLDSRRVTVFKQFGLVYLELQRPADAVQAYRKRLEAEGKKCAAKPGSDDYSSECARGQQDLGIALIIAGDLGAALDVLQQSAAGFTGSAENTEFTAIKMVYTKHFGDSKMYMAVALGRSGKLSEAKSAIAEAIAAFTRVTQNTDAEDPVRAAARKSLETAESLRSSLR